MYVPVHRMSLCHVYWLESYFVIVSIVITNIFKLYDSIFAFCVNPTLDLIIYTLIMYSCKHSSFVYCGQKFVHQCF